LDAGVLCLQIAVHEVDLLETAKALADVLRPDLAHALYRIQLGVGRCQHLVEPAEVADDVRHDEAGQARDPAEDAVAPRADRVVERVQLAVVAEKLGQAPEVQEILVGQPPDLV